MSRSYSCKWSRSWISWSPFAQISSDFTNSLMTFTRDCFAITQVVSVYSNWALHVCFLSSRNCVLLCEMQLILILLLMCNWDVWSRIVLTWNMKIFSIRFRIKIQLDKNETKQIIINKSNKNRAMDACEIANFLASELFMHQVSDINDDVFDLKFNNFSFFWFQF